MTQRKLKPNREKYIPNCTCDKVKKCCWDIPDGQHYRLCKTWLKSKNPISHCRICIWNEDAGVQIVRRKDLFEPKLKLLEEYKRKNLHSNKPYPNT